MCDRGGRSRLDLFEPYDAVGQAAEQRCRSTTKLHRSPSSSAVMLIGHLDGEPAKADGVLGALTVAYQRAVDTR